VAGGHDFLDCAFGVVGAEELDEQDEADGLAVNGARAGSDDLEVALPDVVEADESGGQDGDAPARFSLFELTAV
jgi:hypothetical protein